MSNHTKKEYLTEHLDYCLDLATHKFKVGHHDHAVAHLRNAIETIEQLKFIANEEQQLDEARLFLRQVEGDKQMKEWLSRRLMKSYD